jgi:hypothetical protein
MTTVFTPPPSNGLTEERKTEPTRHPHWCDTRHCTGHGEHVSEQFLLRGASPLIVEVLQDDEDPTPLLSIMEYDRDGVVTLLARQASALAAVLQDIALGIDTGTPLDPHGAERDEGPERTAPA